MLWTKGVLIRDADVSPVNHSQHPNLNHLYKCCITDLDQRLKEAIQSTDDVSVRNNADQNKLQELQDGLQPLKDKAGMEH